METVAGFAWQVLKHIVFSFVFFWPGWLIVKILTLGRYPRAVHPAKTDWLDDELLSVIGMFTVFGGIFLVARLWP